MVTQKKKLKKALNTKRGVEKKRSFEASGTSVHTGPEGKGAFKTR